MTRFSEFHDELRAVAREALAPAAPGAPADWALMARSGWLGLEVPEAMGGSAATFAETALIATEIGRRPAPGPYLGSVVLGTGLLLMAEPAPGRDELLQAAAAGHVRLAVAVGGAAPPAPDRSWTLRGAGGRLVLDGGAEFVPDAAAADHVLVVAPTPQGRPAVVAVAPGRPGLAVEPTPVVDPTRSLAAVTAREVQVDPGSVWPLGGDPGGAVRRLAERAGVAVACDALGVAEAAMEATVAYVGARHQFGRAIGSFQAVKHACADMYVEAAVGRQLVTAAVDAVCEGDPDAWQAVARAQSYVTEAAVAVAGKAMQLHGGIGYTWESGVHLYLKRALLDRSLFGSPAAHRRRLAARYT